MGSSNVAEGTSGSSHSSEADGSRGLGGDYGYNEVGVDVERERALNLELEGVVNSSGRMFITHTELEGRLTLRLAVSSVSTHLEDVEEAWRLLRESGVGLLQR